MADLVMRKRGALVAGEMGLFIDTQIFEEEFASIKQGVDVSVEAKQSRNLKQMRLAWGLCRKIADSGALGDADTREVMNYLLKKAKHVKYIANQHRDGVEVEVIVKSIRFASMDQTAFDRLFNRMLYIVTSEIIPDIPEGVLRNEIEKMSGVSTPEPEPEPTPKKRGRPPLTDDERFARNLVKAERRSRPSLPPPVSIIPTEKLVPAPGSDGTGSGGGGGDAYFLIPADEPVTPPMVSEPQLPSETPAPPTPDAVTDEAAQAPSLPTNPEQWVKYAKDWITSMASDPKITSGDMMKRWTGEISLRNACGITADVRTSVFELYAKALEGMKYR